MSQTAEDLQLTKAQQECIDYKGADLLVRGEPGSGKTVVLLKRARKFAEAPEAGRESIRLITYNRTLAAFAKELVKEIDLPQIKVSTFHSLAMGALQRLGYKPNMIAGEKREQFIQAALDAQPKRRGNKLLERDLSFFAEEITWLKGKDLKDEENYLAADRKGRGSALQRSDRQTVWAIYQHYQTAIDNADLWDWDDLAPTLIAAIEAAGDKLPTGVKVEHILIDEAQDLQVGHVRALRMLARQSLTIAADEAQKIYRTSFAWRDAGINLHGSGSKKLTTSFRSTAQIIALASSLRANDPEIKAGGENVVSYKLPEFQGPLPVLIGKPDRWSEEKAVVALIQELVREFPEQTVGLLARNWRPLYRFTHLLKEVGIPFEMIQETRKGETAFSLISPGVKLVSCHSAKGLEFDFVILAHLNEEVFPPAPTAEADAEELTEQEATERRLLYVSMTRAKVGLYLTYGGEPSRYLKELDSRLLEKR